MKKSLPQERPRWQLKAVLTHCGVSQNELARRLGKPPKFVSKLARNHCNPSWTTALAISDALNCPLDVLAGSVPVCEWAIVCRATGELPRVKKKKVAL